MLRLNEMRLNLVMVKHHGLESVQVKNYMCFLGFHSVAIEMTVTRSRTYWPKTYWSILLGNLFHVNGKNWEYKKLLFKISGKTWLGSFIIEFVWCGFVSLWLEVSLYKTKRGYFRASQANERATDKKICFLKTMMIHWRTERFLWRRISNETKLFFQSHIKIVHESYCEDLFLDLPSPIEA